jgi:hypothetical protein
LIPCPDAILTYLNQPTNGISTNAKPSFCLLSLLLFVLHWHRHDIPAEAKHAWLMARESHHQQQQQCQLLLLNALARPIKNPAAAANSHCWNHSCSSIPQKLQTLHMLLLLH